MSAVLSCCGASRPGKGSWVGPTVSQPEASSGMVPCRPRNCGRTGQVEAFLPAWASWTATGAPLPLAEADDARPGAGLLGVPQPGVARADAPDRVDGGRLGDHQSEAAGRTGPEMDQVPVGGDPVLGLDHVLAHRGEPGAVAHLERSEEHTS